MLHLFWSQVVLQEAWQLSLGPNMLENYCHNQSKFSRIIFYFNFSAPDSGIFLDYPTYDGSITYKNTY